MIKKNKLFRIPKYAAWFYPRRIWYGKSHNIYLTFDDGPHPEITPWLLDELKKQQIKATFFWLGSQVEKHPELLERAVNEGHVVGHHGQHHLDGSLIDLKEFKSNFDQSKREINSKLFRPPYGKLKRKQANYAAKNSRIVMWTWMSYDFDSSLSTNQIIELAQKQIRGGDILVFHENDKTKSRIKKIVPEVIQFVRKKGHDFGVIKD